jgi:hypothetical protein
MINFKICLDCSKRFRAKSNNQKRCKKCYKIYRKSYIYNLRRLPEQKDKKRLYDKKYQKREKIRLSKQHKEYYKKNPSKFKGYRADKDKVRKYNHNYYINNKPKRKRYNKKYLPIRKNKMKNEYKMKNKLKLKARNYSNNYKQIGTFCEDCKSKKDLIFHHTDYKLNLGRTLCKKCHLKEHFPLVYN